MFLSRFGCKTINVFSLKIMNLEVAGLLYIPVNVLINQK